MSDAVKFVGQTCTFSLTMSRAERVTFHALPGLVLCILGGMALLIVEHPTARHVLASLSICIGLLLAFAATIPDRWVVVDADARVVRQLWRLPWRQEACVRQVPFSEIRSIGVDRIPDSEQGDSYHAVIRPKRGGRLELWEVRARGETPANLSRFVRMDPDLVRLAALSDFPREDYLT